MIVVGFVAAPALRAPHRFKRLKGRLITFR